MASDKPRVGILVGGGPAPGINAVIAAATIEARKHQHEVVGFYDGFENLMKGKAVPDETYRLMDIPDVTLIYYLGGSKLRTSRANPTKDPASMQNVLKVLRELNVKYLVTIGGDDTAYSASKVGEAANGDVAVAHVPKTIDNDLPLPPGTPTFGYETARHYGSEIVRSLLADARTTPRWYIVVAMGRTAGHLALGIGKASASPLTVIPEEFGDRHDLTFKEIVDIVEGTILKRRTQGRYYGVAILAEGLMERMQVDELTRVFGEDKIQKDDHGHVRLDDLDLGPKVRDELRARFEKRGVKATFVSKNLGYELRSANPIPFDLEYTRDLGYNAVRFLRGGGNGALIKVVGGMLKPEFFKDVERDKRGRLIPRLVDVKSESYRVAREYMIRVDSSDLEPAKLAKLAAEAKTTEAEFREKFAAQLAQSPPNGG